MLNIKKINIERFSIEKHFEAVAVILSSFNVILVSVYRSPHSDVNMFLNLIDKLFIALGFYSMSVILCGDVNIDVNVNNESTNQFLNVLRSVNCFCVNREPTRGNSCRDNVITNIPRGVISTHVSRVPFSDHDPIIISISNYNYVSNAKPPFYCK